VRPTILQAVLTFAGGIVLAAGSCAGFLATLNFNHESAVSTAFAIGFMLSLAIAGAGFCLIIIRQVLVMRARRAAALAAPGLHATPPAATPGSAAVPASTGAPGPVTDRGTAWTAFFIAALLMATAVACVVLLVVTDPNPLAIVFLALAAAAAVGSLVFFAIAAARYSRGR
jgi:hypothetical protein